MPWPPSQQSYEDRQLAEYRIESSYWDSVHDSRIKEAETVTLEHIHNLRKMGKLDKRLRLLEKRLAREQVDWHELV